MNEELAALSRCKVILHSSFQIGNELNYKLRIRHGLHGFHGFSAMIT